MIFCYENFTEVFTHSKFCWARRGKKKKKALWNLESTSAVDTQQTGVTPLQQDSQSGVNAQDNNIVWAQACPAEYRK